VEGEGGEGGRGGGWANLLEKRESKEEVLVDFKALTLEVAPERAASILRVGAVWRPVPAREMPQR